MLLTGCGSEGTYPAQCGAPLADWRKPSDGYSVLSVANQISVKDDGKIWWNGNEISAEQLNKYSSIIPQMNPTPFTILQIEKGTSCAVVRNVRKTIDDGAKCTEDGRSRCGEGDGLWARIGDVIGPNGENYKYFPNGHVQTIEPTSKARAEQNAIRNEADAVAEKIDNARKK